MLTIEVRCPYCESQPWQECVDVFFNRETGERRHVPRTDGYHNEREEAAADERASRGAEARR